MVAIQKKGTRSLGRRCAAVALLLSLPSFGVAQAEDKPDKAGTPGAESDSNRSPTEAARQPITEAGKVEESLRQIEDFEASCSDCKHRDELLALADRIRSVLFKGEIAETSRALDSLLRESNFSEAERVVDENAPHFGRAWTKERWSKICGAIGAASTAMLTKVAEGDEGKYGARGDPSGAEPLLAAVKADKCSSLMGTQKIRALEALLTKSVNSHDAATSRMERAAKAQACSKCKADLRDAARTACRLDAMTGSPSPPNCIENTVRYFQHQGNNCSSECQ